MAYHLFAPFNNLISIFKSIDMRVHLIPLKCSFYICPYTIMLSFSMTSLKEISTMCNVWFLVKTTQPIEWSWRFELTHTSIWAYPMSIESNPTVFQWIMKFIKAMLYIMCIMCVIARFASSYAILHRRPFSISLCRLIIPICKIQS